MLVQLRSAGRKKFVVRDLSRIQFFNFVKVAEVMLRMLGERLRITSKMCIEEVAIKKFYVNDCTNSRSKERIRSSNSCNCGELVPCRKQIHQEDLSNEQFSYLKGGASAIALSHRGRNGTRDKNSFQSWFRMNAGVEEKRCFIASAKKEIMIHMLAMRICAARNIKYEDVYENLYISGYKNNRSNSWNCYSGSCDSGELLPCGTQSQRGVLPVEQFVRMKSRASAIASSNRGDNRTRNKNLLQFWLRMNADIREQRSFSPYSAYRNSVDNRNNQLKNHLRTISRTQIWIVDQSRPVQERAS